MNDSTISENAVVIERTFDAPVALIWQMWTQPEHFKQWYGPQGFTVPVAEMDVRVGGKRRVCMEAPDASMKIWLTGEFTEVVENARLVFTDKPTDEQGNLLSQAAMGISDSDMPFTTVITVELEAIDERTKMVMTHAGLPAEDQGASAGWSQAFTKMADHLANIQNNA